MPKVSVIMPSLNVAPYIKECIESVINQTLKDIEIICVDAGSTDGTLEILQEYEERDSRIKLIVSDKKSYGYQMNLGMNAANGKYIGIVETDDWVEPDMFSRMYEAALTNNSEVVKSNFYRYTTKPLVKNEFFENLRSCPYKKIFSPLDEKAIFTVTPSIWSGIYSLDFLRVKDIKFNETPGASYQDTSFHFSVFTVADRVYLLKDAFLHYRIDNDNSSVNSPGKVYCVCDEMSYYERFLSQYPEIEEKLLPFYHTLKYEKYRWNYERLSPDFQFEFLCRIYEEFSRSEIRGELCQTMFSQYAWSNLSRILKDPYKYYEETGKKPLHKKDFQMAFPVEILYKAVCFAPKVSVIIPVYKTEAYLRDCLNSVVNQSLHEIEIICVNDGSPDNCLDILKEYALKDNRITVISKKNGGLSSARNAGLEYARGKYIYFLDSDDQIVPDAMSKLTELCNKEKLDIVYFDSSTMYENEQLRKKYSEINSRTNSRHNDYNGIYTGPDLFTAFIKNNEFSVSACRQFIKREFLLNTGVSFYEGILHEDNLFTFTTILLARRVAYSKSRLFLRRMREGSIMSSAETFRNFEGYFICYTEIIYFCSCRQFTDDTFWAINRFADWAIWGNAVRIYTKLPESERKKELETSRTISAKILYNNFYKQYASSSIKQKPNRVQFHQNSSIVPLSAGELIFYYRSYKIGCAITWLPRKIRGGIRCLRDNGFKYTYNRLLEHLRICKTSSSNLVNTPKPIPSQNLIANQQQIKKNYDYYKSLPPEKYKDELCEWYKLVMGKNLNLKNPLTFNEKIQWLKIHDSTANKSRLADKYLVRKWITKKIGKEYLVPLLGVWDSFDEIDFDALPNQFVLKANHGCGWNIIVTNKEKFDKKDAHEKFNKWLRLNYAFCNGFELHYLNIKPRIICEKYIQNTNGLIDYRFYCFNGEPKQVWVDIFSGTPDHKRDIFDLSWKRIPVKCKWPSGEELLDKKPELFEQMVEKAKILSQGFSFVRVDFFEVEKKLYFGEMTFTPMSGIGKFEPEEYDLVLGEMLKVPNKTTGPLY